MTITITLDDKSDAIAQLQEFYSLTDVAPENLSAALSEQIKNDLISRAVRGQAAIDQKAAEESQRTAKEEMVQSILVAVKAG